MTKIISIFICNFLNLNVMHKIFHKSIIFIILLYKEILVLPMQTEVYT
ncbi:hypothetical protein RAMDARK_1549 [Rickettsia amblyommatis str. Darkwater]|nr:hypothetical protein RAMDARK_1549 [Rickettsia amblyommatis str. Darkwater]